MSKNSLLFILLSISLLLLSSCIKQEELNKEADIDEIIVAEAKLEKAPKIKDDEIICNVNENVSLRNLTVHFKLSDGATITPPSGTTLNFKAPQKYTVVSEDGQWKKEYTIIFNKPTIVKKYLFDSYKEVKHKVAERAIKRRFYQISESDFIWASNNIWFGKCFQPIENVPEKYPVTLEKEGYNNVSVKITTVKTTDWLYKCKLPYGSGMLFSGKIVLNNDKYEKQFGETFNYEPLKIKGYCKYKSGDEFVEHTDENNVFSKKGKTIKGKKDEFLMYAVFFETDENTKYLDETNILTHSNIISIAKVDGSKDYFDWTYFEVPFQMNEEKQIEQEKLEKGKYKLAIVMASSKDGYKYNCAGGSTLWVDDLELEIDN